MDLRYLTNRQTSAVKLNTNAIAN